MAFVWPACASAAPKIIDSSASFAVEGTNGYRIAVDADRYGRGRDSRSFNLAVRRGRGRALYFTRQTTISGRRIDANLGKFGEVSVRFHQLSSRRTRLSGCLFEYVRKGVFRGRLDFEGEDRYTVADVAQAGGTIRGFAKRRSCVRTGGGSGDGGSPTGRRAVESALLSTCGPGRAGFAAGLEDGQTGSSPASSRSARDWGSSASFSPAATPAHSRSPKT